MTGAALETFQGVMSGTENTAFRSKTFQSE